MAARLEESEETAAPVQSDCAEDTVCECDEESPNETQRSSADGGEVASAPSDFKLRMLVTDMGRLKMVHATTQRTKEWQAAECHEAPIAPPLIKLEALPRVGECEFVMRFNRKPVFNFGSSDLVITSFGAATASNCPMQVGDRVFAINGMEVETKNDVSRLLSGPGPWDILLRPSPFAPSPIKFQGPCCSIEFSVFEVNCMEDQGTVKVPLRRNGDLSERVVWPWRAMNENVCPLLYKGLTLQGEVVWEAGEAIARIELRVPDDERWNAESLYVVYLDPEGSDTVEDTQGGVRVYVGANKQVSVFSLNRQSFPNGAYGNLNDTEPAPLPGLGRLAWKFVRHNRSEIPLDYKRGLQMCIVPPFLYYLTQLNFGILVNCALTETQSETCRAFGIDFSFMTPSPSTIIALVCVTKVVLTICGHVAEKRFRMLRLGGKASLRLRSSILTTVLQLSDRASEDFDSGDILKAMDTHAEIAVKTVWVQAFIMFKAVAGLFVKSFLTLQILSQLPVSEGMAVVAGSLPIMVAGPFVTLLLRMRKMVTLNRKTFEAEEDWAAFVSSNIAGKPLIGTYKQAWYFVELFRGLLTNYNGATLKADAYADNTMWVVRYVFLVVGVAVLMFGGRLVGAGQMSPGDFLVLLQALDGFGDEILQIAEISRDILLGTEAVTQIACVLNAETWRHEARKRTTVEDEMEKAASAPSGLMLRSVCFRYHNAKRYAVPPVDMDLPSGGLVCVSWRGVGDKSADSAMGINTLFRLMAGALLPDSGTMMVPPRWSTIYIPPMPTLFDGTLMYNIMFSDRATDEARAWEVCKGLGLSAELIGNGDFDVGTDGLRLRFSDRVVVTIARALMHDVDLLLLASCLDILGERHCMKVVRYLRQFVAEGGHQQHVPQPLLHRKTVVYTSKFEALKAQADHVVRLDDFPEAFV